MTLRMLMAFGLALLMSTVTAQAQSAPDAAAMTETTTTAAFALSSADGTTTQDYAVDDISVSVARTSYDSVSEPRADIAISVSAIRPLDSFLLEWVNQLGAGSQAFRNATLTVPAIAGQDTDFVYELDGARVTAFSASHSVAGGANYITLQLAVRKMTINGVSVN